MTCDKCHGYIQTIGCKCEVDELKAQLAEKDKFILGMYELLQRIAADIERF